MSMGRPITDTAEGGVWKYYSVPVSYNIIDLSLNLTSGGYTPEVYVKFGAIPTKTNYDDRSQSFVRTSFSTQTFSDSHR